MNLVNQVGRIIFKLFLPIGVTLNMEMLFILKRTSLILTLPQDTAENNRNQVILHNKFLPGQGWTEFSLTTGMDVTLTLWKFRLETSYIMWKLTCSLCEEHKTSIGLSLMNKTDKNTQLEKLYKFKS